MERLYWNNDWKFAETWEEAMKEAVYPENEMEDVRLPHTCKELPYHYFDEHAYQMLCGYRRHFMAPEAWQGKSVELTFEGVAHDAVVYVNGTEVKAHHCGYTAFSVELAKYLVDIWLECEFAGGGSAPKVDRIMEYEEMYLNKERKI